MSDLSYFTLDGTKISVKDSTARSAATAAQTAASNAASAASTATSTANSAKTVADSAKTTADSALSKVEAIEAESRLEMSYNSTSETITVTTKTHANT